MLLPSPLGLRILIYLPCCPPPPRSCPLFPGGSGGGPERVFSDPSDCRKAVSDRSPDPIAMASANAPIAVREALTVNPGNAPLVVGQLLDDECPEDFIKGLILSVRSLLPVESLVAECEKRYNSAFSGNFNLQKLLILTAIKADSSRVMDYINRLDNFDGSAVGEVAVEAQLYKEAFAIFKKFNLNLQAVNVLLDNIQSIERDVEFAFRVEEDSVWSQVGKVQLQEGLVSEAIESFIRADDAATQFLDVIRAAEDANIYHDLVKYLLMVRQTVKEPKVDSELIYAYAKIDRLGETEEFILMPNVANLQNVGDRLFDDALYEAAKIIFTFISNWAKLASTMVKLRQFQGAADAA
ncbi:hypothetical protein B296_00008399 [Ensete ventricosum]|uniref:Uncharacterized protein n=1 Tax=Ensete ventricosum TaxID=4639 RepID=A0A427A0L4_ENSVE|nr:hypothetical protein B296_00008399 [Ensete ventricosum]